MERSASRDPKRALVIGLASGTTAGSALTHPLDKRDIVEIEPASVPGTRLFDFVNGRPLDDPRTTLKFADARSYLLATDERYDVIISEPSNPWMVPAVQQDLARLGFTRLSDVLAQARLGPEEVAELGQGAPISTDDNGLILFGAPLHVHADTEEANHRLLVQHSNSVAKYLRFPGATPEIEARFLTSLADSYTASGFTWEAAFARGLAESRLDERVGG